MVFIILQLPSLHQCHLELLAPLLALLVEAIGGICRGMIERTSLLSDSADDGYLRHGRICDSLEERNAEKAREAARDHLEESKRRYRRILEGEEISHKYN